METYIVSHPIPL
jgi:hypothetical protein